MINSNTTVKRTSGGLLNTSIGNIFYYVSFALYLFNAILERTKFESVLVIPVGTFGTLVSVAILILLLLKVFMQRASIKQWLISLVVVAIGFLSWRCSNEGWLFWLMVFIVCSQDVDYKILAKISFVEVTAFLVLTILFSSAGVIENYQLMREGKVRNSLGFTHPNNLGLYLLLFCISFSLIRFDKNSLPSIIVAGLAVVFNLSYADSRTSAIMCILLCPLLLVFSQTKSVRLRKLYSRLFLVMVVCIVLMSYYLMFNYDHLSQFMVDLDKLLSSRFYYANRYFEMGGLTLFGQDFSSYAPIFWVDGEPRSFMVDNAYCHLLVRYGVVPTLIFLAGFFALWFKVVKDGQWNSLLFGLTVMSIYGIEESLALMVEYNYFLIALAPLVLFRIESYVVKGNSELYLGNAVSSGDNL